MNSPRRSLLRLAVATCLTLLLVPGVVMAQTTGTIQGFIKADNGDPIPGVTVTVRNTETGAERVVITDAEGFYKATALVSGVYSLTASLEGMQTLQQDNIQLLLGQTIDVNFEMGVEAQAETIIVTSESPIVEVSRSAAASYVGALEIESLPISGRDFKEFALLTPTVTNETDRGFLHVSGQRGIYTGMNIDGTSGKSAFFGYGRGGEATENDGLVVAQDSVKEFQVFTNSFAPEYGANGGGYINVITKSGTNELKGSGFWFFRDDSLSEDIPATPLEVFRGNPGGSPVDEFERQNWGASIGGPIKKDRTHFFFSYDQTTRDEPFTDDLRTRGAYDAILLRGQSDPNFLALVEGYSPNNDGTAAPDPVNGRTATGLFVRSVDNLILFGKLDHQIGNNHNLGVRVNYTDYERTSSFKDEESLKTEDTSSLIGSFLSVIGSNAINDFRLQWAEDNLDRLSQRVGEPIEAQIRFRFGDRDSVGKFDFLPILAEEEKLQLQDSYSYLFGDHDLKFGVDYQKDDLAQLFAGSKDGRYDYNSMANFLANVASSARIYFGNVTFPNYDETQELYGLFAQDSWRQSANLTLNFGVRWGKTDNPSGLTHIFPFGESIPDDDHFAPRFGFAYSPGGTGRDVVRGGIGLFYGRTPTLLFASQVQENGIFPNYGRVIVEPGDSGFVQLGEPIPNQSPPLDTIPSTSYLNPDFQDAETMRLNLGYERQLGTAWSAGVDVIYAEGENLQRNFDDNAQIESRDEFGRPIYSDDPVNPNLATIFVRRSNGESEYTAVTLKVNRRWSGRYQLQAHYTWSEDKDTDSNERSATTVTVSDPDNLRYDWGLSSRDVENRFVLSGVVEVPWKIKLAGILKIQDGIPYTGIDANTNLPNYPTNGPDPRAVLNGQRLGRNTFRNEGLSQLDVRITKAFDLGRFDIDLFAEIFNLFSDHSFTLQDGGEGDFDTTSQQQPLLPNGSPNPEFGIPDRRVTPLQQWQLGLRLSF